MSGIWQQIFALDARYSAYRSHSSQFRTMYIRRRNQLLKKALQNVEITENRKTYMQLRATLLQLRYSVDGRSVCSTSRNSEHSDVVGGVGGVIPTREAAASRALVGGTSLAENYAFAGVHHIFDQHSAPVTWVKFANNDRNRLLCASDDGVVSVCSAASPPQVLHMLRGHLGAVTCCDWSADNDVIVSGGCDGCLRLWAADSGACLRTIPDPARAKIGACVFQPANNNMLVVGNSDGLVSLLNTSAGIFPKGGSTKVGGSVLSLCCEPAGHLVWAGNDKGVLTSLLITSWKLVKQRRLVVSPGHPVTCLSYRQWISREARDPTLLVSCAANAVFLYRVTDEEGRLAARTKLPIRHSGRLVRSTFCPIMSFREGICIVSGSEDSSVYVLDVEREGERAIVNKLQGHAAPVLGVSFNYDESLLATSDSTGLVILWRSSN